jgi:hypothetical protein
MLTAAALAHDFLSCSDVIPFPVPNLPSSELYHSLLERRGSMEAFLSTLVLK